MQAGDGAGQTAELGTWLWIGNGTRPTYAVVEQVLRWLWREVTGKSLHQRHQQWQLYTLDSNRTSGHGR